MYVSFSISTTTTDWCDTGHVTIDILPDDILLEIFRFCQVDGLIEFGVTWEWEMLVHVCRRWRRLVFSLPRYLDLRLVCTRGTRVKEMLGTWPSIPIIILDWNELAWTQPISNIVAALGHSDRVYGIRLGDLTDFQLERFTAATQKRFPALTFLELGSHDERVQALPLEFLGGSAPRLRIARLHGIPCPALPHLLFFSRDLIELRLLDIPVNGYVSPMAMAAGLSRSTRLQNLSIEFRSLKSHLDRTNQFPRPQRHVVLPALTHFCFRGVGEYLEDFVARIHAPFLDHIDITFSNPLIFHLPQLSQFINRTETLREFKQADVIFGSDDVTITLRSPGRAVYLMMRISSSKLGRQVSSLAQVCSRLLPLISCVERLDLDEDKRPKLGWLNDIDAALWMRFFQSFTAVRTLRLSNEPGSLASRALREITGETAKEVLPALRNLLLEDYWPISLIQEAIEPFLAARRHSIYAIDVHRWEG